MDKRIYAAIDANLNRALEGIRVCEDVMRFCLQRADVSMRLKEVRHRIVDASKLFPAGMLLHGRDVASDAQRFIDLGGERVRESLAGVFSANLHRAMEAVRSLEEFGKLAIPQSQDNPFQSIRFSLYEIEGDAVPVLLRQSARNRLRRSLYAILDSSYVTQDRFGDAAARMIRGGASVIQLRMKAASREEILAAARDLAVLCRERSVLCIVNDHVDIAVLAGADGVHLGRNDLGPGSARRLLPPHMIIGVTSYTDEDPGRAEGEGADYIAVGPVFDTVYHSDSGPVNLNGSGIGAVSHARASVSIPIVAVGGMTPERIGAVIDAGADSAAVSSYLYQDNEIEANCRALTDAVASAQKA